MKANKFKDDQRKKNPGLHLLYVEWAIAHLKALDDCISKLEAFSNLNMLDSIVALGKERAKLVRDNAAYFDADRFLRTALTGEIAYVQD
jgi:hypothetical protein